MGDALDLLRGALEREEDGLLTCVHCGFCLPACPTYRRLGDEADSPRGRLHLMRAVAEGRVEADSDAVQVHLDRCLGCRACEPVCPSGVPYGALLEEARAVTREARPPGILTRMLPGVMGRPLLRRLVLALGRFLRGTGLPSRLVRRSRDNGEPPGPARWGLAMLAASAPALPRLSPSRVAPAAAATGAPATVVNLDGCVQEGLFGRVNEATRQVLEANGIAVREWRGQGCCGALHAHAGDLDGARRLARHNIRAFRASGAEAVCANAAGCGAAMKGYGHLLRDDPAWAAEAAAFSGRVRDVSELLAHAGPRSGAPLAVRVAYDPPCHLLHAQGVHAPVQRLLAAIPELEVVEVQGGEECCGGAGTYGLTHPELGGAIGADKVGAVQATRAAFVATGNPGCMMQIGAGLLRAGSEIRAVHPVELLAESYRRMAGTDAAAKAPPGRDRSGADT